VWIEKNADNFVVDELVWFLQSAGNINTSRITVFIELILKPIS